MPRDLNKVMIIGNLGADPEMRFTANGTPVTSFRIAVNRSFQPTAGDRRDETEWFSVVAWNKLAETCNQFLGKGRRVYVEGRLQTRSWEGQDGQRRYRTEIVAMDVIFLDRQGAAMPDGMGDEAPVAEDQDLEPEDLPF